jgi:hypothetical protein
MASPFLWLRPAHSVLLCIPDTDISEPNSIRMASTEHMRMFTKG